MAKIGIFGGTFDPPHRGHVAVAAEAARLLALDRLLVIPTGIPPHKVLPPDAPDAEDRLAMTRLAFADIPIAEVREDELRREGKSYTYLTLEALRQEMPEAEFWLIMGADMFLKLESWKEARRIFAACSIAALCREKIDDGTLLLRHAEELNRRYGADCRVLRHQVYEVSSTSVRDGDPATDGRLPQKVCDYIRERGLYGVR